MNEPTFQLEARVIAFSPSFIGKDGKSVDYPKYTLRFGSQIAEAPVRGVVDAGQFLDKDVSLEVEIYPSKTKAASLRIVGVKLA